MTASRISLALVVLLAAGAVAAAQDQSPPRGVDEPPVATQDAPDAAPPSALPDAQAPPPGEATGAPTPLGTADDSANAPVDQPPAADQTPQDFKPGILSRPAAQSVVTTDSLSGVVDGPPVGTLDEAHGGLGPSMWVNAPRGAIEELLGRIPVVSYDPFVRGLARRVLLTPSESPTGQARRTLVAIRIEKLLQAGLIEDAATIAASLQLDNDADFGRVQADALLYGGRDKDVCGDSTAARLTAPEPFWLKLRAYCFAATGDSASADLTRGIIDGQGLKDPAFTILMGDVLSGEKKAPPPGEQWTSLHIYLLRKAGYPVTGAIAGKLGTVANLYAARDPRNTPADRLAAASRISATGALSNSEMLAILNAQQIAPKDIAGAQATAAKLTFLPAQGLLHRAALLESRPPAKVDLLVAALLAGHLDRLPQTAALQGDVALSIRPEPSVMKGRALIARALVLNGKLDAASAWYAGAAEGEDAEAFKILVDLAAPSPTRDSAAQSAYAWFAANAQPQKNPDATAALALRLNDVLGRPMPPTARSLGATLEAMRWPGSHRPDADAMRKLIEVAGQPGRKGEMVLRLLDIVGADGPQDLPADVVIECVRVLQQAGMPNEARALAIEALAMQLPS